MPSNEQNSPATSVSEVFDWFRQGAGFGMFIGIATAIVTQADYWACVLAGVVAGLVVWPLLAAVLTAVTDQRGTFAGAVRCLGRGLAGIIFVLFVASALIVFGLKIYVDFAMPSPSTYSSPMPHATLR